MRKNKKTDNPNILVEKQKFYISEFEQEAAWLSFMHKEGWKFVSTDGFHYQFEKADKEDWVYELDYKENGVADEDYLQMYKDYGWEYVGHFNNWFYFRIIRAEDMSADNSIFSDRESKLELCKRILKGQLLRLLPLFLLYGSYISLILFTDTLPKEGFLGGLFNGLAVASIIVFIFLISNYISQLCRIQKMMKELGHIE